MTDRPTFDDLRIAYDNALARLDAFGAQGPAAQVIAAEQEFTAAAVNLAVEVPALMAALRIARSAIGRAALRIGDSADCERVLDALSSLDRLI